MSEAEQHDPWMGELAEQFGAHPLKQELAAKYDDLLTLNRALLSSFATNPEMFEDEPRLTLAVPLEEGTFLPDDPFVHEQQDVMFVELGIPQGTQFNSSDRAFKETPNHYFRLLDLLAGNALIPTLITYGIETRRVEAVQLLTEKSAVDQCIRFRNPEVTKTVFDEIAKAIRSDTPLSQLDPDRTISLSALRNFAEIAQEIKSIKTTHTTHSRLRTWLHRQRFIKTALPIGKSYRFDKVTDAHVAYRDYLEQHLSPPDCPIDSRIEVLTREREIRLGRLETRLRTRIRQRDASSTGILVASLYAGSSAGTEVADVLSDTANNAMLGTLGTVLGTISVMWALRNPIQRYVEARCSAPTFNGLKNPGLLSGQLIQERSSALTFLQQIESW